MANSDMAQYLGVFLDEAGEQLELLEQGFLALEQAVTPELLQDIFRAAHTLKGSARAMGFTSLGELTHAMEDVFDLLRGNKLTVTSSLMDVLFETLDTLKRLIAEIAQSGDSTTDTLALSVRLRACMGAPGAGPVPAEACGAVTEPVTVPLSPSAQEAMRAARQAGCAIYAMTVRLAGDCLMKSVRALMVLQTLETVASLLATSPEEEALENEEFGDSFGIVLATGHPAEELLRAATATAEIADVLLQRMEADTTGDIPAPNAAAAPDEPAVGPAAGRTGEAAPPADAVSSPPPEARAGGNRTEGAATVTQSQTVRVDVSRLDNLLNLVGELVIDQTRISQLARQLDEQAASQLAGEFKDAAAHFGQITSELQEVIMKARMLPIDHVFNRFPRMVRDLAHKLGKELEFHISGRETELDRSVIEVIADPLIHLLRNCVDHGIERPEVREAAGKPRAGSVRLSARHAENHIVIIIEDDGQGIAPDKLRAAAVRRGLLTEEAAARLSDREAINLIFASGLSTTEAVSDVSGRGVGMDIVRNNLTHFGALIDVESKVGEGTRFTIKLPLTLAIIRGLLVRVASGVYAIPLSSVLETIRIPTASLHQVNRREIVLQRGIALPLLRLHRLFYPGGPEEAEASALLYVVVVGAGERRVGLVIDHLLGEQEIVIKSLGKFIGNIPGISGATILGDGRIALIMDIQGLLARSEEER